MAHAVHAFDDGTNASECPQFGAKAVFGRALQDGCARAANCASSNGQAAAQAWAQAAGIGSGKSRTVQRGRRYAATVTDYQSRGRLAARLVEVDKLGHAWSGGASRQAYSDALGPDASRLVWSFAAKHFSDKPG